MQEAKKIKLGAFLLLSISLFILSLISTGIHKVFEDKIQAITAVKTSVDGLSIGAPVKYLGMTVGKITKMTMHTQYGGIIIYFTINAQAFEDEFADKVKETHGDNEHSKAYTRLIAYAKEHFEVKHTNSIL